MKDAPGALRDLTAVRTLAILTDPSLMRQGPEDPERLLDAEDFYLRIRSVLHLETRRNHNLLTHALQERVADVLGYPGPLPQPRVERLMGDYFRHARVVTRALEWAPAIGPTAGRCQCRSRRRRHPLHRPGKAAVQPATWLAVFQAALDGDCHVSNEALVCMRQNAERFPSADFFPTPAHRAALLRFLTPRTGIYARLSEMHDCGVLGRMLPPFQAITYRVVRDFYHRYTVDEHTLLTVRNLERLTTAEKGRERFATLLRDLEAPELLVLALLLIAAVAEFHGFQAGVQAALLLVQKTVEQDDGGVHLIGRHFQTVGIDHRGNGLVATDVSRYCRWWMTGSVEV